VDVRVLAALWQARRAGTPRRSGARRLWSGVLLGAIALELALGALWAGWTCARRMPGADPVLLGTALWRIPLGLGLAGALWDGGCVLSPRPLRPFFVRIRTLLLAELLLGLSTGMKRALFALAGLFALGAAARSPVLLPWALLSGFLAVLWVACLERLLPTLLPASLLRQRILLLLLAATASMLAGLRLLGLGGPLLFGWRFAWLAEVGRVVCRPGSDLVRAGQAILSDPKTIQAASFHPSGQGGVWAALLVPLAATLLLLALTAWAVRRELAGERAGLGTAAGPLWSFRRPWAGVARLQFQRLLASRAGQLRLFVTFVAVLVAKEPELISAGRLHAPRAWVALSAAFAFGALLIVPLCNLFGLDRGGVRSYWILPLADRDLLLGKLLGVAGYGLLGGGLILLLLAAAQPLRPLELVGIAELLLAAFLWHAGSGLARSLRGAWGMTRDSNGIELEFSDEKVARLGVLIVPLLWLLPLFAVAVLLGPWALLPAMAAAALLAGLRLRAKLAEACLELAREREALSAALARS
jgi:hypothetical protein